MEVITQKIIILMNQIMLIRDSDELSDTERETRLKALNIKLVEMKKYQAQLIKAL